MKDIEKQLNSLQDISLNKEEKSIMRNAMVSYMEENPVFVRNQEDSRLQYRTSRMSDFNYNNVKTKKYMMIGIIIALLLGGGGTSFAAESALPGDLLYPIKVHVNENVQELVAVSDEAEAKLQAKLAEDRLEEAEKLAAKGELTAETSADLKARFEERSEKSKEHRAKVAEKNNTDAAENMNSDVEISLGIHARLLEDLEETKPEMKGLIGEILEGVQHHLKDTGETRAEIETKIFAGVGGDVKVSVEGVAKAAQNKIDEVKKFVGDRKSMLNAGVQAEVDAHVKAADAAMVEGRAKVEAKAYADAFALFKKAAREAQTAKLFATTAGELKMEIRGTDETGEEEDVKDHSGLDSTEKEDKGDSTTTKDKDDGDEGSRIETKTDIHVDSDALNNIKIEAEGNVEVRTEDGGISGKDDSTVHLGL